MGRGESDIIFSNNLSKAKKKKVKQDTLTGEPLSLSDRAAALHPMIWEAQEDINGEVRMGFLGKGELCRDLSDYLAKGPIGREIGTLYNYWEKEIIKEGLYEKILAEDRIENRRDLIKLWAGAFSSPTRENRGYFLKQRLPRIGQEGIEKIIDLLPEPHHLLVRGDSSLRKDHQKGRWSLEITEVSSL